MGWTRLLATITILAVGLGGLGVAVSTANSAPLANAGLDQHVEQNTTVYLDAGGSTDPDGSIAAYQWRIETPAGGTTSPDCPTCAVTQFRPTETGQYNVTVTVTDDDGATSQDTLYVTVDAANPPSVELNGPQNTPAGNEQTYTASVTAGDADLSSLTWKADGNHHENAGISGEAASVTTGLNFEEGSHTISATVIDRDGKRHTDSLSVSVHPVTSTSGGGGGGASGGGAGGGSSSGSGGGSAASPIIVYNKDGNDDIVVYQEEAESYKGDEITINGVSVSTEEIASSSDEQVIRKFTNHGITNDDFASAAAEASDTKQHECHIGVCSIGVGEYGSDDESGSIGGSDSGSSDGSDDSGGSSIDDSWWSGGGSSDTDDGGSSSDSGGDSGDRSDSSDDSDGSSSSDPWWAGGGSSDSEDDGSSSDIDDSNDSGGDSSSSDSGDSGGSDSDGDSGGPSDSSSDSGSSSGGGYGGWWDGL